LEINDRFCSMLGYTFNELTEIRPWELVHPEDLKEHQKERGRLISGEAQNVSAEIRYLRKDGNVVWIARTVSLVRDASGTPQYLVGVYQDVTRWRHDVESLQQAQELSSGAMTASHIAFFRWNLHSQEWEWDRTQQVLGPVPEELLHTLEGLLSLTVPEDRAELFERLNRSAKEGVDFEHEFRITLPPDEEVAWIYSRGSILRDQAGQAAYLTGAFINMTEYKHLRRDLQERQEVMLLAASAGGVYPWAIDAIRARRIWWTPNSYQLYGRREDLGPPTREEFVKLVHPEHQDQIRELYQLLDRNGSDDIFRLEFRTAPISGRTRWILTKGRVQRDPGGWPLRMVGVDIDITDRRETGEAMRRMEKLTVLERLAMTIAHEVNNPLMALANTIYLISQSSALEDAKQYAKMAQEEIRRITHYSRRMLRFRRQPGPLRPQRVSEVVQALLSILRHRYPNVNVITDFRDRRLLESSKDDLEQLFGILLGNAFDAVATGGSVDVRIVERANANTESGIRVIIGDTGKGMSTEVKARLFEPFFSTKDATGLGLGLWIASGIVKNLQGRIRIRSSDAQALHGTVVSVFLPFRSALSRSVTSTPSTA
jgi:PAS domain S-box-containing protein